MIKVTSAYLSEPVLFVASSFASDVKFKAVFLDGVFYFASRCTINQKEIKLPVAVCRVNLGGSALSRDTVRFQYQWGVPIWRSLKVIFLRLQTFSINFNHQNLILFQNICLLHNVLFSHQLSSLKFYSIHRISRIYEATFFCD